MFMIYISIWLELQLEISHNDQFFLHEKIKKRKCEEFFVIEVETSHIVLYGNLKQG